MNILFFFSLCFITTTTTFAAPDSLVSVEDHSYETTIGHIEERRAPVISRPSWCIREKLDSDYDEYGYGRVEAQYCPRGFFGISGLFGGTISSELSIYIQNPKSLATIETVTAFIDFNDLLKGFKNHTYIKNKCFNNCVLFYKDSPLFIENKLELNAYFLWKAQAEIISTQEKWDDMRYITSPLLSLAFPDVLVSVIKDIQFSSVLDSFHLYKKMRNKVFHTLFSSEIGKGFFPSDLGGESNCTIIDNNITSFVHFSDLMKGVGSLWDNSNLFYNYLLTESYRSKARDAYEMIAILKWCKENKKASDAYKEMVVRWKAREHRKNTLRNWMWQYRRIKVFEKEKSTLDNCQQREYERAYDELLNDVRKVIVAGAEQMKKEFFLKVREAFAPPADLFDKRAFCYHVYTVLCKEYDNQISSFLEDELILKLRNELSPLRGLESNWSMNRSFSTDNACWTRHFIKALRALSCYDKSENFSYNQRILQCKHLIEKYFLQWVFEFERKAHFFNLCGKLRLHTIHKKSKDWYQLLDQIEFAPDEKGNMTTNVLGTCKERVEELLRDCHDQGHETISLLKLCREKINKQSRRVSHVKKQQIQKESKEVHTYDYLEEKMMPSWDTIEKDFFSFFLEDDTSAASNDFFLSGSFPRSSLDAFFSDDDSVVTALRTELRYNEWRDTLFYDFYKVITQEVITGITFLKEGDSDTYYVYYVPRTASRLAGQISESFDLFVPLIEKYKADTHALFTQFDAHKGSYTTDYASLSCLDELADEFISLAPQEAIVKEEIELAKQWHARTQELLDGVLTLIKQIENSFHRGGTVVAGEELSDQGREQEKQRESERRWKKSFMQACKTLLKVPIGLDACCWMVSEEKKACNGTEEEKGIRACAHIFDPQQKHADNQAFWNDMRALYLYMRAEEADRKKQDAEAKKNGSRGGIYGKIITPENSSYHARMSMLMEKFTNVCEYLICQKALQPEPMPTDEQGAYPFSFSGREQDDHSAADGSDMQAGGGY